MSAKNNHCMNKLVTIIAAGLLSAASLHAQQYERMVRHNLWNDGENLAALRQDSLSLAEATVRAGFETGELRSCSESAGQWSVNATARAVRHLENFSMTGSFAFENLECYDMCGSMFLENGFFPVDVYEFTPGRKSIQTYAMMGGISVDLGSHWRIGGGIDFTARNAAKLKDLRYSSARLDLKVNPSILYVNGRLALGASFIYVRNTETINAEQVGSTANAPFAFFDEGLAIGNWQVWTGNGVHLKESGVNGLPVKQNTFGGALQFQYGDLYFDGSFGWLDGVVGERQSNWYRYSGPQAEAHISFRTGAHTIRGSFDWMRQTNCESVLDKVVEGGITTTREYAGNTILRRNVLGFGAEYEYMSEAWDGRIRAALTDCQAMSTPLYPDCITRDEIRWTVGADASVRPGKWELRASLSWSAGVGTDTGSASCSFRKEDVYSNLCEYATTPVAAASLTADWNIFKEFHAFLKGDCSYGWKFKNTGAWRPGATIGISVFL